METSYVDGLLSALARLDALLAQAINTAQTTYGGKTITDPFRGLHISQEEVERLLTMEPGAPRLFTPERELEQHALFPAQAPLGWLTRELGLSSFEVDVIILALAPELDLRYERLYAYLQDNVSRKWPCVELALNLLCLSTEAKIQCRQYLTSSAPLLRYGLLHLVADPNQVQPPLLAQYLKLDERFVSLLLHQHDPGPTLSRFSRMIQPDKACATESSNTEIWDTLAPLVGQAYHERRSLRLHFYGPGSGKRHVAKTLAAALDAPLLYADAPDVMRAARTCEQAYMLLMQGAWLHQAILYIDSLDVLYEDADALRQLLAGTAQYRCITIFASSQQRLPELFICSTTMLECVAIPFPALSFGQRLSCWQTALADVAAPLEPQEEETLAARFRLNAEQIRNAVLAAHTVTLWRSAQETQSNKQAEAQRGASDPHPYLEFSDLFAAARSQSGYGLEGLARRLEPAATWEDLILPPDQVSMLREVCNQARYSHVVYEAWGFARKLRRARGLHMLFSGSPGTGKTLAAEVIAYELGLDLYRIDLSQVVSKYIGETEKNLERIFSAAERLDAILFFDEADSLFGKRSQVHDAHDRYANIEVSYLLQCMEDYEGITILATNLRQNMDEAFTRRMHYSVDFPFPDETHRYHIWRAHFPTEAPRADDIDFGFLARQFKLAGGNIKNIVLTASFLAAAERQSISMKHVMLAARREFQKLGKECTEAVFGSYLPLVIQSM